ncbi:uncharacterized protein LOC134689712 [Mytilus trossulus]|uniref:uncharacterized protein LOC134689712 n=1 Tax=Mytilus trossulus TaxID=6551 RepID=UPI00300660D2
MQYLIPTLIIINSLIIQVDLITTEPTTKNMTACQQLRLSSIHFSFYVPECTNTGEYEKRQCEGRIGYRKCWCVDSNGRQILGSQMMGPEVPDCDGGFLSWSLKSNPNIFGKSFDLTCSLSAPVSNDNSSSNIDGSTHINVVDGEPVDDINQLGERHTLQRTYTLTTSVYNNDGVNVQYECGHGNTRYGHLLNMTIESFKYTDTTSNFHQLVNNEEDLFSITFRDYTQVPNCTVVYGQSDRSKQLNSTSDSTSQTYRIYRPVIVIKSECPKALKVTCDIGERRIVNNLRLVNVDCQQYALKHTQEPSTTKMTACQKLRSATKTFSPDFYVPECTITGEYEKRQCEGKVGSKLCWCVDPKGREIQSSQMMEPEVPDCDAGTNLKPCIFELLKISSSLLRAPKPRCTDDGEYEEIQCHVQACWCVDKNGIERMGTRVSMTNWQKSLDCESSICFINDEKENISSGCTSSFSPLS